MAGSVSQLLDPSGATLRESPVELPGEYRLLREDQLEPNPWNPNEQDPETFAKEKVSLRRFGFVVPIIVRPHPAKKGVWQIIDGEHRLKAGLELQMQMFPSFDVGPISDHEAQQLTVILNELRGKPNPVKLGEVLKRLLASDSLDRLTEVMPYSKEEYGKIAHLPEFDWGRLQQQNEQRAEKRWVERIFRLPVEAAKVLDEAIRKAKEGEPDMTDAQALEAIAADFLGGE